MPTRIVVGTKNAIYYVENETIRGLISIISQVGLSLTPLLEMKESLVTGILFHLEHQTLTAIQLEFLDRYGNTLTNSFGVWLFEVAYGSSKEAVIEFPVNRVLHELRTNSYALSAASSYQITLNVRKGSPLPPGWRWSDKAVYSSANGTRIGSFGYSPLDVSIHRTKG